MYVLDIDVTRNGNNLKLKVKSEFSLSMGLMVINHSNPYIHSTTLLCDIIIVLCIVNLQIFVFQKFHIFVCKIFFICHEYSCKQGYNLIIFMAYGHQENNLT